MSPKVADPGKPLPAMLAAEGFLSCVNPLVFLQVSRFRESFPAGVAAERFLSCVHSLMGLQVGQTAECFSARSAHVALPAALTKQQARTQAFIVEGQHAGWMLCGDTDADGP